MKHADFQTVYSQGKKHFSGNMTAFYREREDNAGPRVGLTVGKALGGAVERNRIRRRMRAAVACRLSLLTRPLDLILHPRKSVLALEFASLQMEVGQVFSQVERGRKR